MRQLAQDTALLAFGLGGLLCAMYALQAVMG